jgi:hypothetical protein
MLHGLETAEAAAKKGISLRGLAEGTGAASS